ncbi:unnamed protein product [Leptidea sinapis]|uniref:Suppressor of white apricot N-terminal domain-containing protein n=1 Tax=Leptidea sinapis TaxID=189913 RepID=A0A5E4Q9Z7_9NEOP|nr:unnamed protein product [Leptidea sinapis]
MWHEARRQEKMIRGMIVDYRRRAERRKDFYEKIKADPTQFLQIHGRPCKVILDPAVAAAGEGPAIMMPWQGDPNNMIDRFDVRAHLDYIAETKAPNIPPENLCPEERQCNYERYRILAQNVFLGISEDKFLEQLAIEEQFGVTLEEKEMQKGKLNEKKGTGVAIGYNYNDPGAQPSCSNGPDAMKLEEDSDDESEFEIIDVDLSIDVNKMEASQAHALNAVGPQFGMAGCDLFSFLTGDADDAEHQKQMLREEKEKALFSGRKSRRERRAHRPPSYAAKPEARDCSDHSPTHSHSKSPSPEPENIEFITSFGPEDEEKRVAESKPSYSEKLKRNLRKSYAEIAQKPYPRPRSQDSREAPQIGPRRRESRSRSRSKSISRSRSSRSKSYSRSRSRSSRSRSRSPYRSRSRSRSRNYRRRSRSMLVDIQDVTDPGLSHTKVSPRAVRRQCRGTTVGARKTNRPVTCHWILTRATLRSLYLRSAINQNQTRIIYDLLDPAPKSGLSREPISMKERLRRKMQAQLSKQSRGSRASREGEPQAGAQRRGDEGTGDQAEKETARDETPTETIK